MKIGYQLKQVRERLLKGLVDKGVLRTEKRNFLLFDMATHPVADMTFKDDVLRRALALLTSRTAAVPTSDLYSQDVRYRTLRAVCMVCAAFAANVLENALVHLGYESREAAFGKCDELLAEFSQWPFGAASTSSPLATVSSASSASIPSFPRSSSHRPSSLNAVGTGGGGGGAGTDAVAGANLAELARLAKSEIADGKEVHIEVVAAVLHVFSKMVIVFPPCRFATVC
jgi:Golgi phosphoprotein 3